MLGQADDLGGGVYKKRLGRNLYRSILVAKGGRHWVYEYLFAKQNRGNIDHGELMQFRKIAAAYAALNESQIEQLVKNGKWLEICNGSQA